MSGALSLRHVTKTYGPVRAIVDVSLDAAAGEFVTLLGPSGSGKTTTLQMIAGFTEPDSGQITLDGNELVGMPPYRRNIGMVFQNYALFPHMTVEQNLAFPLAARGQDRAQIRRRIGRVLDMVGLNGLEKRLPRQLSGGQQQRVAIGRSIIYEPPLLLMDEPLGALDKKLRDRLQLELMELSRSLGITVIYVTHDQEEALVMSNRIAVFNQGRIEQLGTQDELYERPASVFVADFIGESNMISGILERAGLNWAVRRGADVIRVAHSGREVGEQVTVVIRPERLLLDAAASRPAAVLDGRILQAIYLGPNRKYVIELSDGVRFSARLPTGSPDDAFEPGQHVQLSWELADATVLPGSLPSDKDARR